MNKLKSLRSRVFVGLLGLSIILGLPGNALALENEWHITRTNNTDTGTFTQQIPMVENGYSLFGINSQIDDDGAPMSVEIGGGFGLSGCEIGYCTLNVELDGSVFQASTYLQDRFETIENSLLEKADFDHGHSIGDISLLQLALSAKANTSALGAVAFSNSYNDLSNKPTRSFGSTNFAGSTTGTRLSTTRDATVQYAYDATVSISVLGGQSIEAILEYADDQAMTTNVVRVDSMKTANSGVIGLDQTNTLKVEGMIPAGKYRQVRFVTSGSGVTAPSALASNQEVLE